MSVGQSTPYSKLHKTKRGSVNRPQSAAIMDSDFSTGFKSDIENDSVAMAYKARLHTLFAQIEKEFDLLYQENQSCKCNSVSYKMSCVNVFWMLKTQDKTTKF